MSRFLIEHKAILLNFYINKFFQKNPEINEARPHDLMYYLISKRIYKSDHRNGQPLRNDLRKLRDRGLLSMIETVDTEEHDQNTYWYFRRKH